MAVGSATWTLARLPVRWLRRADEMLVDHAARNAGAAMTARRGWDLDGLRIMRDLEQAVADNPAGAPGQGSPRGTAGRAGSVPSRRR